MKGSTLVLLDKIPPSLLILLSTTLFIAGGALTENYLIGPLGVLGAPTIQFLFAALFLIAFSRPNIRKLRLRSILNLVIFGLSIYGIEISFFAALEHLPLGVVVTIGFCGPLLLSLIGSKSPKDILWFILAGLGLYLITPFADFQQDFSYIGYLFALVYSACIIAYIFLSKRLCNDLSGIQGLAIGMGITAVLTLPISLPNTAATLLNPMIILIALGISLIGLVLPYAMDYIANGKLELKTIGILSSTEPLIGGVIGFVILGETLTWIQLLSFALIGIASVGSSLHDEDSKSHQDLFIIPTEDLALTFIKEYK